jgi:hypothetical protein
MTTLTKIKVLNDKFSLKKTKLEKKETYGELQNLISLNAINLGYMQRYYYKNNKLVSNLLFDLFLLKKKKKLKEFKKSKRLTLSLFNLQNNNFTIFDFCQLFPIIKTHLSQPIQISDNKKLISFKKKEDDKNKF